MELKLSKEWLEKRVALEEGQDVSAGASAGFQPEPVERDEYGWWLHSALRDGEDEEIRTLPGAQGMELYFVEFYDDASDDLQQMYERGCSLHGDEEEMKRAVREWQPTAPQGPGWFMLGVWDGEDGPCACYTRPSQPAARTQAAKLEGTVKR